MFNRLQKQLGQLKVMVLLGLTGYHVVKGYLLTRGFYWAVANQPDFIME